MVDLAEMMGTRLRQVRHHRQTSSGPTSGPALSALLGDQGTPMTQSTLSRTESGSRDLTVRELLGLAVALDVPPLTLLVDLTGGGVVEVAPGVSLDPSALMAWFGGRGAYTATRSLPFHGPTSAWHRRHWAWRTFDHLRREQHGDARLRPLVAEMFPDRVPERPDDPANDPYRRDLHVRLRAAALGFEAACIEAVRHDLLPIEVGERSTQLLAHTADRGDEWRTWARNVGIQAIPDPPHDDEDLMGDTTDE